MGGKNVFHFGAGRAPSSGELRAETLERLAATFVADSGHFASLVRHLRRDRVLVLSGAAMTGRRAAALMLLREVGAVPVHALLRNTEPERLAQAVAKHGGDGDADGGAGGGTAPRGYLLDGLTTYKDRPLREPHLLAARDRLEGHDAYLVITLGTDALLEDIPRHAWSPPDDREVLAAHLIHLLTRAQMSSRTESTAEESEAPSEEERQAARAQAADLLAHPAVPAFLNGRNQLREVVEFAGRLAQYAAGRATDVGLRDFSEQALRAQVREWFAEDETNLPLREKAFLVALAAFDGGPYALTAELSDRLFARLQNTADPGSRPRIPVFGTHSGRRLAQARAREYAEEETTEWGPVLQRKSAFHDELTARVLLRELWTDHPSARPALVGWLHELAGDRRPLVRTRAAATAALLAQSDLPSAIALLMEDWADSTRYRHRMVAAQALALTHLLGSPNVLRLLEDWVDDTQRSRRWVAIRTWALIGPEHPLTTLGALRRATREEYRDGDPDPGMLTELAEAVELMVLSPARDTVLAELLRTVREKHAEREVQQVTLSGYLRASAHTTDERPFGPPLLLAHYAQAVTEGSAAAHELPALWRLALSGRETSGAALAVLRDWVLAADRDDVVEWSLAALLPRLVETPGDRSRLTHLLRTMPGEDKNPPPPVTTRLLAVLSLPGRAGMSQPVPARGSGPPT